jgi:F1F0 ATPase subunit 2
MMNDFPVLLLAATGGGFLGVFYFVGLRWTLRKALASKAAALWFLGSFLLRNGVCLYGIYWIGANDLLRILACLGGFIVARMIVIKLTGKSTFAGDPEAQEAEHAP